MTPQLYLQRVIFLTSNLMKFSSKMTPRKFVSFTLTTFWLSILIWILQIEHFCLGLKTINLVFLRFRESLFAWNQIDSLSIFKFKISERNYFWNYNDLHSRVPIYEFHIFIISKLLSFHLKLSVVFNVKL